jgi:hypothetical protein
MSRTPADTLTGDLFAHAVARSERRVAALVKERELSTQRKRQRGPKPAYTKAAHRLREIERLIKHRHGTACDTDDGEAYLAAAIPSMINREGGPASPAMALGVEGWRARWVPLVPPERAAEMAADVERAALARERIHLKAGPAGVLLALTVEERSTLRITSMRAAECSTKGPKTLRKERDRERKRKAREAAGMRPQSKSKAQLKPWVAAGISRTKWYEIEKARTVLSAPASDARTVLSPLGSRSDPLPRTDASNASARRVRGPARDGGWWQHAPAGFAPSVINPASVRQGHAVAQGLPENEVVETASLAEWRHPGVDQDAVLRDLQAYHGGRLTEPLAILVHDALRERGLSKSELARIIGTKPPQVIRALNGTRGFSQSTASNLKRWLGAAA